MKSAYLVEIDDNNDVERQYKNTFYIKCHFCSKQNSFITDVDRYEIICSNCGVVISENLSEFFGYYDIYDIGLNTQTSSTSLLSSSSRLSESYSSKYYGGTSTTIGNKLNGKQDLRISPYFNVNKLRKYDKMIVSKSYNIRNLKTAFDKLYSLRYKLRLTDAVIEKIAYLYKKIVKKKIFRGYKISTILYAVTYAICREAGIIHSINEIADLFDTKKREISKFYRQLILNLDIKIPLLDPIKCIVSISNKIPLNEKIKYNAIKIMRWIMNNYSIILNGKNPMITAGAIIYYACLLNKQHISQRLVAYCVGVSEVSIRKRFIELKENVSFPMIC
ncbi:MAG: transcription initiation factor IIB [Nitrososphaeraceae archaeon]